MKPFLAVRVHGTGTEAALVEGVARRIADLFGGRRLAAPGPRFHRPGQVGTLNNLKGQAGALAFGGASAAIAILLDRLLR